MRNKPIGIFDSGVGGISVWNEVVKLLPNESIVYLADSKNCPYGSKSEDEIIKLSEKNTQFLLNESCKMIIVACNTATAAAIEYLRRTFSIPFVGMEPAVKPAAINSKTKNIGILATEGTFNGKLFNETSEKFTKGINVHLQVGYGLVESVEAGELQGEKLQSLLYKYLNPMLENNVDNIVLGCTHFPFLKENIQKIVGDGVNIIDPSSAVANRAKYILNQFNIRASNVEPVFTFYTTGKEKVLLSFLDKIDRPFKFEKLGS